MYYQCTISTHRDRGTAPLEAVLAYLKAKLYRCEVNWTCGQDDPCYKITARLDTDRHADPGTFEVELSTITGLVGVTVSSLKFFRQHPALAL